MTAARESFKRLVESPSGIEDLARAALLIAAEEYPSLAVDVYLGKLDELAERVRARAHRNAGPHETLSALTQVLVVEEGFSGNREHYYDPRNSFLNDVLDRHKGIPITLSTVYMEVAKRIDFPLKGVAFPGHYLVKHDASGSDIVIDPFHDGRIVGPGDLQTLLRNGFDGRIEYKETFLDAVGPHEHVFRMLANLKGIFVGSKDARRALSVVERMLLVDPDATTEHRDRGVLLARLDRSYEALLQLTRYRELLPDSDDADDVDSLIEQLKAKAAMSN